MFNALARFRYDKKNTQKTRKTMKMEISDALFLHRAVIETENTFLVKTFISAVSRPASLANCHQIHD
jgi:hypothetical protein